MPPFPLAKHLDQIDLTVHMLDNHLRGFLCADFHVRVIDLAFINDSVITLIPNDNSLETPDDYIAISLHKYYLDLLTKSLVGNLQSMTFSVSSQESVWAY